MPPRSACFAPILAAALAAWSLPCLASDLAADATGFDSPTETTATKTWRSFLGRLLDTMAADDDPRGRALATVAQAQFVHGGEDGDATPVPARADLAGLADAHPDSAFVQWLAALDGDAALAAEARRRLGRIDADNLATWIIALGAEGADRADILPRMAAARRYDDHFGEILAIWIKAADAMPLPDETERTALLPEAAGDSPRQALRMAAAAMASASSYQLPPSKALFDTCTQADAPDAAREACIEAARLMVRDARSVLALMVGTGLLGRLDASGADDAERKRRISWWQQVAWPQLEGDDSEARQAWLADLLASKSEIEALRRAAERAGKAEPPEGWTLAARRFVH